MAFSVELPKLLGPRTYSYDLVAAERKISPAGANFDHLANGTYVSRPSFAELATHPPRVDHAGTRPHGPTLTTAQLRAHDASFESRPAARSAFDTRTYLIHRDSVSSDHSSGRSLDSHASVECRMPAYGVPSDRSVDSGRGSSASHVASHESLRARIGARLHRAFESIRNLFHKSSAPTERNDHSFRAMATPEPKARNMDASTPLERGRDRLAGSIPTLERLLQQETQKPWHFEQFPGLWREMELGALTFASLANRGAREGQVSEALAERMGIFGAHPSPIANDQTGTQLRSRVKLGDKGFLENPLVRHQLLDYIADLKECVLDFAAETGKDKLADHLQDAWRPFGGRRSAAELGPAIPRLLEAVPRLTRMLAGADQPTHLDYLEFRKDLNHVADGLDLCAWHAAAAPERFGFAQALTTLASHPPAGSSDNIALQLWEKIRARGEEPGDPAFFADPAVRAELRGYLTQATNAVVDYIKATGRPGSGVLWRSELEALRGGDAPSVAGLDAALQPIDIAALRSGLHAFHQASQSAAVDTDDQLSVDLSQGFSEDAISDYGAGADSLSIDSLDVYGRNSLRGDA